MSEQSNNTLPGYYNHYAICGLTAGGHYPQVNGEGSGYNMAEHDFVPLRDERIMASPAPTWPDFWALQDRVEQIEAQLSKIGAR